MNDIVDKVWCSLIDVRDQYDYWRRVLLGKPTLSVDEKLTLAFLLYELRLPVESFDQALDAIKSRDIENKEQLDFFEEYFSFDSDMFIEPDLYIFYSENDYRYAFMSFHDSLMLNDFFIDDIKKSDDADTEESKAKIEQLEMANERIRKLREECIKFFLNN